MGWVGLAVSVGRAASRASARAERKRANEQAASQTAWRREVDGWLQHADALDRRVASDPIEALALRYVEGRGVVSTLPPGPDAGVSATLLPARPPAPPTVLHQADGCSIMLLDLRVAPFGVVAALRVEALAGLKLELIVRSDPKKSPVFVLDRASGSYMHPRATTLPGVIVPGTPAIGLVLFDPLRAPVTALEVHAVDLKLQMTSASQGPTASEPPAPVTFVATYAPPWLAHESEASLRALTVRAMAEARMHHETQARAAAAAAIEDRRREDSGRSARAVGIVLLALVVLALGSCGALFCIGTFARPDPSSNTKASVPPGGPPAKGGAPKPRR
jgi:hypothetical protein